MRVTGLLAALVLPLVIGGCSLNSFVFHTKSPVKDLSHLDAEEVVVTSRDGQRLQCLFLRAEGDAVATVFVLPGQGGNVTTLTDLVEPLRVAGFQVFLMGYQGYGRSEGTPTFKNLLADSESALHQVRARPDVSETKLIVLGLSLGGSVAVELARRNPGSVDALAVEGTFTTLKQIALHKAPVLLRPLAWTMVRSPYNSLESISKLSMPKLIVHSRDDAVVPMKMAKELYRRSAEPRELWEISGAHCLGLIEHSREYIARLNELVAQPRAGQ